MTHTYSITGMTCGGCVAKVKSELLKLPDVAAAEVQLESPQATISMQRHIPDAALLGAVQKAGARYTITPSANMMHSVAAPIQERATSYLPVILIFAYITGVSLIIQAMHGSFDAMEWMRHFMGGFFLVFLFSR